MAIEKSARAELIAALVTDKFSGFRDGDEPILEAASDARLEEFRVASETHKTAASTHSKLETEMRMTTARLKVAEDRVKTSEQSLSEEEFIAKAPPSIKALLDTHKQEEDAVKSALISSLKDLGANTEEELKAKSIPELKTLAAYARVDVPDFSGLGLPKRRDAEKNTNDYTPPDPYAAGIKALQAKVN